MADEAGLAQLLDTLRARWKLLVPVAVAVFALSVLYVESLPATYSAQAVVAFGPRPEQETAGSETVRIVAPKYVAFATAPATVAEVASEVGENPEELTDALAAEITTDTGNLTLTVTLTNPRRAAQAAEAFADEIVQFAAEDELLTAQLVAEAVPPREPSGPPRRLLEAAGLALGLLLGVGSSFVAETQRPRLRSWTDMARMTGYRVIGRVPSSRKLRARPTEALADPLIGSAFRTLRTNLERESQDRPLDLIVVTSPDQGDGKTTVSGLLAESLARLGTKVLLVDADLRRPNISRTFAVDPDPGFAQVLRGTATLDEAVRQGWTEGLSVLPAQVDAEAGDLLARRFLEVMTEARGRYEAIVVDTPPLLGLADARSIAAVADGVLLVVSSRRMAEPVNEAVLALETLKAPVIGVVANRLREEKHAYQYLRGQ